MANLNISINLSNLTYKITNLLPVPQRLHDICVQASYQAEGAPACRASLTDGAGVAHELLLIVQQDSGGWFYLATLPHGSVGPYPTLLTVAAGETVTLSISSDDFDLSLLPDSNSGDGYGLSSVNTYAAQATFFRPTTQAPLSVDVTSAPWSAQVIAPTATLPINTEGITLLSSVGSGGGNHRELIPQLLTGFLTASEGMALTKVGGDVEWRPATGEKSAPFSAEVHLGEMAAANFVNLTIPLPSPLLLGTLVQILGTLPDDFIGVTFYADPQYGTVEYHGEALSENNWLDDVQGWRYRSTSKTLYARIVNYGTATSGDLTLRIEGEALA